MQHDIRSQVLDAIDRAIAHIGDAPSDDRYVEPLNQARSIIEAVPPYRPCRLCMDYLEGLNRCTTWNQEIPPEWREVGCDRWLDTIPF